MTLRTPLHTGAQTVSWAFPWAVSISVAIPRTECGLRGHCEPVAAISQEVQSLRLSVPCSSRGTFVCRPPKRQVSVRWTTVMPRGRDASLRDESCHCGSLITLSKRKKDDGREHQEKALAGKNQKTTANPLLIAQHSFMCTSTDKNIVWNWKLGNSNGKCCDSFFYWKTVTSRMKLKYKCKRSTKPQQERILEELQKY